MSPKTVLIRGCSSGIGLALAVKLAKDKQRRFKVIATMRNVTKKEKLEAAAGPALNQTLEIKQLDVCDEKSIHNCINSIPQRHIDILINNAGLGFIGPIECQSIEDMKAIMETNFFGVVRMIKEVLPDMKKRRSGHIVVISSVLGLQGIIFNIYAASKFAIEGFCESLIIQALRFNIFCHLIEPGPVVTEFEMKIYEDAEKADYSQTDHETAEIFSQIYMKNSRAIFSNLSQTPEDVAEMIISSNYRPPFRHQTNAMYTPRMALKQADPTGALMTNSFYKLIFRYDKLLRISLRAIQLLRWQAHKVKQGARLLGFR
ncbi:retinol dehydrogenase 8-like [Crotalus tigris]|uniref:retinol dehydrogenase 8-like n=1 Tax=Crotalus tigris TaxID=88082 RepID=UPI00192FAE9A|nr:retinol dehydrogenase 8-like [Crotalus tigris]